ncbi:MAG: sensor histidine kinase, partial [Candidatus Limnocylindrales bacterium]
MTWPVRMRSSAIGFRLFLAFQAVIVLTGMIGILAVERLNTMSATVEELNMHDLPEVVSLGNSLATLYRLRRFARDPGTASSVSQASLPTTLSTIAKDRADLIALEQSAGLSGLQRKDTALVQDLIDGLDRTRLLSLQVQKLVAAGQIGDARALSDTELRPLIRRNLDLTNKLRISETKEVATESAEVQQAANTATQEIIFLTSLSIILSIVLAVLMTRSVVQPLSELLRATEAISTGNLEVGPRVLRRDELGRLATAFDSMRGALRETIGNLDRERRQTQAIIDATADGIVLISSTRKILQMNPAAERLSGWTAESAVGHSCWEVFGCCGNCASGEGEQESLCPLLGTMGDASVAHREYRARLRNGRRLWLAENCAPIVSDPKEDRRFVVGFRDITQIKAVEQMKSDFVAMVSHELRAPLTTVLGSVEMLTTLDSDSDREASHEVLSLLQHQTQRLQNVVEEVLQLTRFEAGRLTVRLEDLKIGPFLQDILDQLPSEWL